MHLSCRIMIDGTPHHVTAAIESAAVSSSSRAALVLRVIEATAQGVQRRSERAELYVPAVVTALVCYRITPDEPLSAVITDVSEGGLALSVADTRPRENDRLRLRVRVLEGMIGSTASCA
jgi:PilZ domain-containing protein